MKLGDDLLYLSRADVRALDLAPEAVRAAVEGVLVRKAGGGVRNAPKLNLLPGNGRLFQAMIALDDGGDPPLAATKVIGLAPDNGARGLPHIAALIVLADGQSGVPVAVMDATWITAARTAALTAVAARRLARPDSESVGFVACGVQARSHLAALRAEFPIRRVRACSWRPETAERFAAEARAAGLEAAAVDEPRDAVAGLDIVVTSVPPSPEGLEPFLDPDWLAPGSFASLVDLGRSWLPEALGRIEVRAVDDHEQTAQAGGKLAYRGPFDADLTELVTGQKPGRRTAEERAMFIFQGLAAADLALAALVYARARERSLGVALRL